MKKLFVILVALIGLGVSINAQNVKVEVVKIEDLGKDDSGLGRQVMITLQQTDGFKDAKGNEIYDVEVEVCVDDGFLFFRSYEKERSCMTTDIKPNYNQQKGINIQKIYIVVKSDKIKDLKKSNFKCSVLNYKVSH